MEQSRTGREWHLVRRPVGEPVPDDFALVEAEAPALGPGQVLVRNLVLSVDPYMRGRMDDRESYAPPYALGEPMTGGAVGVVVESSAPQLPEGQHVVHGLGWRELAVVDSTAATPVDVGVAPASAYLGALGMPGLTAYAGLVAVAGLQPGETVLVTGAAGAVGSMAGQIARLRGAGRVVGSAGSPEKVAWLVDELGFDAAFDYHDDPVAEQLARVAPDGIDVLFDNVGGEHLEAAVGALRVHGRGALCGSISGYNAVEPPPGPRNLSLMVGKRLTLRGFLVGDHADLRPAFVAEVGPAVADGRIVTRETSLDGIERAVDAFLGLLRGANTGKMLVRLDS